jgi:hypothetical protein
MNPLALFATRTATLRSPLSPQACAERIGAVTDGMLSLVGTRPLIGSVSAGGMTVRRRLGYRNSFQTELRARFEPNGSGTTIRCRFGLMGFVVVFMVFWLAMVLLMGAGFIFTVLSGPAATAEGAMFALIPVGFLVFGLALPTVGKWFARNDESIMLETVRAAADATVAEREPGYVDVSRDDMDAAASTAANMRMLTFVALGAALVMGLIGVVVYFSMGSP